MRLIIIIPHIFGKLSIVFGITPPDSPAAYHAWCVFFTKPCFARMMPSGWADPGHSPPGVIAQIS